MPIRSSIGDAGAGSLASALQAAAHLSALQTLAVSCNSIGDAGAASLAAALQAATHLSRLRLQL